MRWPADHPLRTDELLAEFATGVEELCPEAEVVDLLRYVPSRRVASLVTTEHGPCVLKVFARPRARGNHRRLQLLASSAASGVVPRSVGVDRRGHVSLVAFVPGTVHDRLDDRRFVTAAAGVGAALALLHRAGVELDRTWTVADEVAQLQRQATERTRRAAGLHWPLPAWDGTRLGREPLVPCHRDVHPRQVVVADDGTVRFIDLDDAAAAPAGLDLGNFAAHLRREQVVAGRAPEVVEHAVTAVRAGYRAAAGRLPTGVDAWERLAMLRLIALAESRHRRLDWADALAAHLRQPAA